MPPTQAAHPDNSPRRWEEMTTERPPSPLKLGKLLPKLACCDHTHTYACKHVNVNVSGWFQNSRTAAIVNVNTSRWFPNSRAVDINKITAAAAKTATTATEDVHLVEFMYIEFTRMPAESYRRRLTSLLLYLCYVFLVLINSLAC